VWMCENDISMIHDHVKRINKYRDRGPYATTA